MFKKELKKTLHEVDEKNLDSAKKTGIVLARENGKLYIDAETIHSLIIGTTRSGKGQTFVLPMIRMLSSGTMKQSMILNDPKGEILENTHEILKKNGYKIYILNLVDTEKSHLWNPLQVIVDEYKSARKANKDLSKVTKLVGGLAQVFTDNPKSDPIWPMSAKSLLTAMILYLLDTGYNNKCLDKLNMYSVYNFFLEYGGKDSVVTENGVAVMENALDKLFKDLPVGHPAKLAYATSNFASGDMRSSIFSTLASNIDIFGSDTGIAKLTAQNQIDFTDIIDTTTPCAVFMVVPDEDVSRHVIASLFVNQCYASLIDQSRKFPMQRLPRRVQFILDEFGNMVRIPDMDNKITISLGRNILFNLFLQDLNQLDSKYDKVAKTIRSNCGNIIYIYSIDNDTNKYFSQLLGNETVEYRTYSGKLNDFLNSQSVNIKGRALITADELSVLKMGETVIKKQRCYPIFTAFKPFYKLKLPIISIDKIPIEYTEIKLYEWLFPFSAIDNGTKTNLDTEDGEESFEEGHGGDDNEEYPQEIDPELMLLEQAMEEINQLTSNEFRNHYASGNFGSCLKLVNTLKLNKKMSEDKIEVISEYIEQLCND